jgi:hypothetical protein
MPLVTASKGPGCGLVASSVVMKTSRSARQPVTVSYLPVVRCRICLRTVAHRPGEASAVLTEHYRRAHGDALPASTDDPA